jgi:hypothetical protein
MYRELQPHNCPTTIEKLFERFSSSVGVDELSACQQVLFGGGEFGHPAPCEG